MEIHIKLYEVPHELCLYWNYDIQASIYQTYWDLRKNLEWELRDKSIARRFVLVVAKTIPSLNDSTTSGRMFLDNFMRTMLSYKPFTWTEKKLKEVKLLYYDYEGIFEVNDQYLQYLDEMRENLPRLLRPLMMIGSKKEYWIKNFTKTLKHRFKLDKSQFEVY